MKTISFSVRDIQLLPREDHLTTTMAGLVKTSAIILVAAIAIYFADQYFSGGVCKSEARLDGKTVIVTGGNTGIGKETAIDLAARGAKVIIACRSRERGEKAVLEINRESGSEEVYLQMLDLASFKSVRAFAKRILETETRLDVLINNAGIYFAGSGGLQRTEDGYEKHFQVNHLGHFLLTELLLDLLKKSAPSRIINVSSMVYMWASPRDLDNIHNETIYIRSTAYEISKLANIVHAKELSRRHSAKNVTAYSLHPGVIATEITRYFFYDHPYLQKLWEIIKPLRMIFFKTSKEGAQTTICLAVSEGIEKYSGNYFADCEITPLSPIADDKKFADKLWKYSMEATRLE